MTAIARTTQQAEFVRRYGPHEPVDRFLFEDRLAEVIAAEACDREYDMREQRDEALSVLKRVRAALVIEESATPLDERMRRALDPVQPRVA